MSTLNIRFRQLRDEILKKEMEVRSTREGGEWGKMRMEKEWMSGVTLGMEPNPKPFPRDSALPIIPTLIYI